MQGRKIEWTPEMDDKLRREFPHRITIDICKDLGISLRSAIRRARVLGIEKEEGFLEANRQEITNRATKGLKTTDKHGGRFVKGQHAYPEGEFKKGHTESEEAKKRRIEKGSATRRQTIYQERLRLKYGLPQRTKLKLNKRYYIPIPDE